MKIFNFYNRIKDLVSELRQIEIFLRRFPDSKFYEKNEIDILAYFKYHTEVFYHKIATILDILKLMTNEIYALGIPEKKCTWQELTARLNLKRTPELLVIENYYKSFEHIITARHLNTHQAFYYDDDTEDIRFPLFMYKNIPDIENDYNFRRFHPKFLVKYRIKEFRKKRLEYVRSGNDVAEEYINQFINFALPNFQRRRKSKSNGS